MHNNDKPSLSGFENFGISSQLLQVLKKMKIFQPTPIQYKSIPVAISGKDVMGIAQTGTGKTLAFGIPLVERLNHTKGKALVLLPTRELAHQAAETFHKIGNSFHLRSAVLIGGESMYGQIQELRRNPRIIIATPGRLIDHLEQRQVQLHDIKILVLDEADRMLDMGFAPQLNQILKTVPRERQTLLFSATMPPSIVKLASTYMSLPVRVEVAPAGSASSDVEQEIFIIGQESKLSLLEKLLQEYQGTVLVFSRTKFGAKKIAHVLKMLGHKVAEIHSNRSQSQRREAMSGFKSGRYRVLVATDIAARGIDVHNIELVVNFDLPDNSEDYVHRIGRTGRAGNKGRAISFATPQQRNEIRLIERLIRKTLTISKLPELKDTKVPKAPSREMPERNERNRRNDFRKPFHSRQDERKDERRDARRDQGFSKENGPEASKQKQQTGKANPQQKRRFKDRWRNRKKKGKPFSLGRSSAR